MRVRIWDGWTPAHGLVFLSILGVLLLFSAFVGAVLATAAPRPGRVDFPAPPVPPSLSAPGLWWFDGRGLADALGCADAGGPCAGRRQSASQVKGGAAAPGTWQRSLPGGVWEWSPLAADAVAQRVYISAATPPVPEWPADPAKLRVERFLRPDGKELGYWVWNPSVFELLPSGSHRWSPRWQWTPAGQPLLLTPEPR